MKDLVKVPLISVVFATMSSNSNAEIGNYRKDCVNSINTSLFENLNKDRAVLEGSDESLESVNVDQKIIVDAVLDYFDEDVKMYKLSPQARQKLVGVLNSYLKVYPILVVGSGGKMEFVISDKKEFALMVKQFINIVLDDMPFFVRKIVIPLFLGGNDTIQQRLDNLGETAMNLKEKQYEDVVFDYIGGVVKRVAKIVDGKMTVKEYYDDVSGYYPNKNGTHIVQELDALGQSNIDIKSLKYPFNK